MSNLATDTVAKTTSVTDAYTNPEERVLDPTLLDKSLLERMPNPTGWRLLVLPYKGKGVRYADERVRRKEAKKK